MDENSKNKTGKPAGRHLKQAEPDPRAAEKAARAEAAARKKAEKEAEQAQEKADREAAKAREAEEKQAIRDAKAAKRKRERSKGPSGVLVGIVALLVIAIVVFAGMTAAGWYLTNTDTNLKNVYIGELNVGGLTKAQTQELLESNNWNESQSEVLHVTLPGGIRFKLDYLDAGAHCSAATMADIAYSYGHNSGWYGNLFTYLLNQMSSKNVNEDEAVVNSDYIQQRIQDGVDKYNALMSDSDYHVDLENGTLTMLKGAGSVSIDAADVYTAVCNALAAGETELNYTFSDTVQASEPDFDAIASELNVEVQDAYFDDQFNIIPEVSGVIVDANEARSIWEAAAITEKVEIPVTLNEPEVTSADLESLLYRDLLASTTTSFWGSTENRINNINLAVGKINGTVLLPGEIFSYNGTVGERTAEAGFKMAGAYSSGQVVQQLGGGICQVSSTLYKTTMLAQMKTIERTCHQFRVGYLEPGYDATVDWPGVDFKFQNAREYPIRIVAYCDNDAHTVTVEIWGTDTDGSYVELSYGCGTVYDPDWAALGYQVKTGTTAACNVQIFDKDGNLINSYVEDYSSYDLHSEDIETPNGWTLEEARAAKEAEESGGDTGETGGDTGGDTGGETGGDGTVG